MALLYGLSAKGSIFENEERERGKGETESVLRARQTLSRLQRAASRISRRRVANIRTAWRRQAQVMVALCGISSTLLRTRIFNIAGRGDSLKTVAAPESNGERATLAFSPPSVKKKGRR